MRKTKLFFFKTCILLLVFSLVLIGIKYIIRKFEPTRVFEIPDSSIHYDKDNLEFLVEERYAMIINPPRKSIELKNLMLDYCKKKRDRRIKWLQDKQKIYSI